MATMLEFLSVGKIFDATHLCICIHMGHAQLSLNTLISLHPEKKLFLT